MPSIDPLVGKPLTFFIGGKKRQIGKVTAAQVRNNALYVAFTVTDAEVAELLGIESPATLEGVLPSGVQTS